MRIRWRAIAALSVALQTGVLTSAGGALPCESTDAVVLSCAAQEEKEGTPSQTVAEAQPSTGEVALPEEGESVAPLQAEEPEKAEEYLIEDFEIIWQMPELPTGCEITAMTMALRYYGLPADKMEMATRYLPTASAGFYYGDGGRLYGPDLERYFVGDPATQAGYICGPQAILTAANAYLADQGSSLRAVEKTGASPEQLYRYIRENTPVVVWVTISMEQRRPLQGWYTEDGRYVEWSTNDHGAVLIGYTQETVTIADPISGLVEYDRQVFEEVFASRGNQCVVLE